MHGEVHIWCSCGSFCAFPVWVVSGGKGRFLLDGNLLGWLSVLDAGSLWVGLVGNMNYYGYFCLWREIS